MLSPWPTPDGRDYCQSHMSEHFEPVVGGTMGQAKRPERRPLDGTLLQRLGLLHARRLLHLLQGRETAELT